MSDDYQLQLSVAFAIGKTALRPRSRVAADNDRDKLAAARIILDHLKLCGYTITPGPGAPLHSTHGGPSAVTSEKEHGPG